MATLDFTNVSETFGGGNLSNGDYDTFYDGDWKFEDISSGIDHSGSLRWWSGQIEVINNNVSDIYTIVRVSHNDGYSFNFEDMQSMAA